MASKGAVLSTMLIAFLVNKSFSAPTAGINNVTISGAGISNHGDPNLLCVPTTATDVLLFFLSNYLAHALTVRTRPGASSMETFWYTLDAFIHPAGGITIALDYILAWSWRFTSSFPFLVMDSQNLNIALRSSALVVAMRNADWQPAISDGVLRDLRRWEDEEQQPGTTTPLTQNPAIVSRSAAKMSGLESQEKHYTVQCLPEYPDPELDKALFGRPGVHGGFELPPGYDWERVPQDSLLQPYGTPIADGQTSTAEPEVRLTASVNIIKPIIAIFQSVSAGWALYQARGDQLQQYGYTAFGLTVAPYLVMSIVNFVAQLATPDYNSVYIVSSEILKEAALRAGNPKVIGIVAELVPDCSTSNFFESKVQIVPNKSTKATIESKGIVTDMQAADDEHGDVLQATDIEVVAPWPAGWQRYKTQAGSTTLDQERRTRKRYILRTIVARSFAKFQEKPIVGELIIPFHPRFQRRKEYYKGARKIFKNDSDTQSWFILAISVILAILPLVIIMPISMLKPGIKTTTAHQAIFIAWMISIPLSQALAFPVSVILLAVMCFIWYLYALVVTRCWAKEEWAKMFVTPRDMNKNILNAVLLVASLLVIGGVSIAMFVLVGQELVDYGNCQYYSPD